MKWKRYAAATVLGFVALMAVDFVWHLVVPGWFWQWAQLDPPGYAELLAKVSRPAVLFPVIAGTEFLRGAVYALIFPIGYRGGSPWREGPRFGVLMGLVSGLPIAFLYAQFTVVTAAWFWADLILFVLQGAVAGIAIALCYSQPHR